MKFIRMNAFSRLQDADAPSAGMTMGSSPREPEVQTAGRKNLGDLAPQFAALNDDVLFGQVWSRTDELSPRDRSLITIAALFSAGLFPQLKAHLQIGRAHGITRQQAVETVTQLAFYCGWPKAWSALPIIREVYADVKEDDIPMGQLSRFPLGPENTGYARYFTGKSYLAPLTTGGFGVFNVTFAPGVRNFWHIHHATKGGGQIIICVAGRGWYQEWGKAPVKMLPGDTITIPANVKHWHGAAKGCWFQHLAISAPGEGLSNEWLEKADDDSNRGI
ncbi:MAG: carboxymuconolactone decarboxylase family protein [Succinivibrio sp.]